MLESQVLTVSALNIQVKQLLEQNCATVQVEGEVSNFIHAQSGHCYFSLKDKQAQVRCALFRSSNNGYNKLLQDGAKVRLQARVTLYERRGDYQLLVSRVEAAGLGDLHQQFLKLQQKLQLEGLFAEQDKRPLPLCPKQ